MTGHIRLGARSIEVGRGHLRHLAPPQERSDQGQDQKTGQCDAQNPGEFGRHPHPRRQRGNAQAHSSSAEHPFPGRGRRCHWRRCTGSIESAGLTGRNWRSRVRRGTGGTRRRSRTGWRRGRGAALGTCRAARALRRPSERTTAPQALGFCGQCDHR